MANEWNWFFVQFVDGKQAMLQFKAAKQVEEWGNIPNWIPYRKMIHIFKKRSQVDPNHTELAMAKTVLMPKSEVTGIMKMEYIHMIVELVEDMIPEAKNAWEAESTIIQPETLTKLKGGKP